MLIVFQSDGSYNDMIRKVSGVWEPRIVEFLEPLYSNVWIPSHDIEHHKRVWKNAVEICRQLHNKTCLSKEFYEEMLICCLFHDSGLMYDQSERHGKESRRIAEEFLTLYKSGLNINTKILLQAIENHDNKDYDFVNVTDNLLLEILSIADDIDALGATGLYRYIEIYLIRGIDSERIPELIIANVASRYKNLEKTLEKYNVSSLAFRKKYCDLLSFIGNEIYHEPSVSLVNWINTEIVIKKNYPGRVIHENMRESVHNNRIRSFIEKYLAENRI